VILKYPLRYLIQQIHLIRLIWTAQLTLPLKQLWVPIALQLLPPNLLILRLISHPLLNKAGFILHINYQWASSTAPEILPQNGKNTFKGLTLVSKISHRTEISHTQSNSSLYPFLHPHASKALPKFALKLHNYLEGTPLKPLPLHSLVLANQICFLVFFHVDHGI